MTYRIPVKQRRRGTRMLTMLLVSRVGKQRQFVLSWHASAVANAIVRNIYDPASIRGSDAPDVLFTWGYYNSLE